MVELKLDPLNVEDLPSDCYASVRIGEVQKLSKLSPGRTYRFPKVNGEPRRYGKIEIFQRIGQITVDVDPINEGSRDLKVKLGGTQEVRLKVDVTPEKPVDEDAALAHKGSKVKAAKTYLAKHSLETRLSEAMQSVLRERPEDPTEFLAMKLRATALPPLSQAMSPQKGEIPVQRSLMNPRPNSRSQVRLEPMQGSMKPQALSTPKEVNKVLPFNSYYAANFGSISKQGFEQLYKKFPVKGRPTPKATVSQLVPFKAYYGGNFRAGDAAWLKMYSKFKAFKMPTPLPPKEALAKFQFKPSVGSWLAPLPPPQPEPEREHFNKLPSVGTWLAAPPKPKPKPKETAAPPPPPAAEQTWASLPSTGTWLALKPPTLKTDDTMALSQEPKKMYCMMTSNMMGPNFYSMGLRPGVKMF